MHVFLYKYPAYKFKICFCHYSLKITLNISFVFSVVCEKDWVNWRKFHILMKHGKHSKLFAYKSHYHHETHLRNFKCLGKQMFNSQQLLFTHPLSPFCLSLASTYETEMNWKLLLTFKSTLLHREYWNSLSTLAGFQSPFLSLLLSTNRPFGELLVETAP